MLRPDQTSLSLKDLRLTLDDEAYPNLSMYTHVVDVSILVTNHLQVERVAEGLVDVVNGYVYEGYETDYDQDNDLHAEFASGIERELDEEDFEVLVGEALRDLNDQPSESYTPLAAAVGLLLIDDDHVVDLLIQQGQLDEAIAGLTDAIQNHGWDDVALALTELERDDIRAALAASPAFQACLSDVVTDRVARNQPLPFPALIDVLTRARNISALEQLSTHPAIPTESLQMLARHPEPTVQAAVIRRP